MNTFQRAGATVGLSIAVGTAAYAAERAFEPGIDVNPTVIAEEYQQCAVIPEENIRNKCATNVESSNFPITWLGVVQLGCLATGIVGGVVAYRNRNNGTAPRQ